MNNKSKIAFIAIVIITALVSGLAVSLWQEKSSEQNTTDTPSNEISLGSILVDASPTLKGSPSKYSLPIKEQETLSVIIDNPQIINDVYIGGNFYLVTKNSHLEELDRHYLGDQFIWGIAPGMRNFGLDFYKDPEANEVHVPKYRIKLEESEQSKIWENYYRIDDGKIFVDENLPNNI